VEKGRGIKYAFKKHAALAVIEFPIVTFPSMLHLFFIFVGTGF
jgi:hypothetical protein